jgi:hypothetical protein
MTRKNRIFFRVLHAEHENTDVDMNVDKKRRRLKPATLKIIILAIVLLLSLASAWLSWSLEQWIMGLSGDFQRGDLSKDTYLRFMYLLRISSNTLCGFIIVIILLQIIFTRWRNLRVFISFHLSDISKAQEIANALKAQYILTDVFYSESAGHDDVVDVIRKKIMEADSVLVLPGATTSFVDAEILAATIARKTVVLITTHNEDKLPNTAYQGYPVFFYDELLKRDFRPLADFLNFIHADFTYLFNLAMTRTFFPLIIVCMPCFIVFGCVDNIATLVGYIAGWSSVLYIGLLSGYVAYAIFVATLFICWAWTCYDRYRAARIARQSILTGTATYDQLKKYLLDTADIIDCVKQSPLEKRY